jgi:hypothetical protein
VIFILSVLFSTGSGMILPYGLVRAFDELRPREEYGGVKWMFIVI